MIFAAAGEGIQAAHERQRQWSLRTALLTSMGVHPDAHPVAYWQYRELEQLLDEARERIRNAANVSLDVDTASSATIAGPRMVELLTSVESDLAAPASVSLRPWCELDAMPQGPGGKPRDLGMRFRIPWVPIGACVYDMLATDAGAVGDWLDIRGIGPRSTSFEVVDLLDGVMDRDPSIDRREAHDITWRIRAAMMDGPGGYNLVAQWLHDCDVSTVPASLGPSHDGGTAAGDGVAV